MTIHNENEVRERLVRIETIMEEIQRDVHSVKKEIVITKTDIDSMKLSNAKVGGVILAVSTIGAFLGWILNSFKGFIFQ